MGMNTSILQQLEVTANKFPDKVFLADKQTSVTYSEFIKKAKTIASNLIKYNLKNQPIIVETKRNIETIIMFFGVLYSGNFYVPIDSENPKERTTAIMKNLFHDIDNKIMLSYSDGFYVNEISSEFEIENEYQIINEINHNALQLIDLTRNVNDPIYMIYTSGSTGLPKGVIKSHLNIISFVEAFVKEFNILSEESLGNQTPFYFDASAKDIYVALYVGATIEIIPKEAFSFPMNLIKLLNDKKITMIQWVPSALNIVSQFKVFKAIKPLYLKKVFFVGEVMPIKYINDWFTNVEAKFYNLYGSSETAGIVCYYEITKVLDETERLPIGKALSNAQILVVNDDNKVCNKNENGEIFIRGAMLAQGYYNNKELTDKVFVQNPLHNNYNDIVYKSGDVGYFDDNNNLMFVCRKDYQIKHMGHRIELGDIEVAVNSVKGIKECCCVYSEKTSKIILYYSLLEEIENSIAYLKNELQTKLPNYMLPNRFTLMEELPKNQNGKIERKKLKELVE